MPSAEAIVSYRDKRTRQLIRLNLDSINPNPYQPRRSFSEESIAELAESIYQYGLLSPLIVRQIPDGSYELIAGERRLRALKKLGQEKTDAILLPVQDRDCALLALVENIQREDLTYFEEAEAYQMLIRAHGFSQDELAKRIGRSQSCIANRMRLLKLPPVIRDQLMQTRLSERHARALLQLTDMQLQQRAVAHAALEHMSVRQFEAHIARLLAEVRARRPMLTLYRDHRIFVNAVLDTVKRINAAGIYATSSITELEDHIEVTVKLPKIAVGEIKQNKG